MIMIVAMNALSFNDAIIKLASDTLSVAQILLLRGMVATAILVLVITVSGEIFRRGLQFDRWTLLRGLLETGGTLMFVTGLTVLPIGIASTLVFTSPIILTILAAAVLGETVGWWRWSAVIVGFIGVILITHPQEQSWSWQVVWPLLAAGFIAGRDIVTRYIDPRISSLSAAVVSAFCVTVAGALSAPFNWQAVTVDQSVWLALAGVLLCVAYFCYISAIRLGELSFVAPFNYTNIVTAIFLGALIWGDRLVWSHWCGVILIIVSGCLIAYREARARQMKNRH